MSDMRGSNQNMTKSDMKGGGQKTDFWSDILFAWPFINMMYILGAN